MKVLFIGVQEDYIRMHTYFCFYLNNKEISSDSNYKQIITGSLAEFHVRDPHILNNLNIRDSLSGS